MREAITEQMTKRVNIALTNAGHTKRDDRLSYCSEIAGRQIDSTLDLTMPEARLILNTLDQAQQEPHHEQP